jgi:Ribonuclease G/E
MRLRDWVAIIVVDFIGDELAKNRKQLYEAMEDMMNYPPCLLYCIAFLSSD